MFNSALQKLLQNLSDFAHSQQSEIWVVGGAIRDYLLSQQSEDLDLVLEGDILNFAPAFASLAGCKLTEHNQFLTAKLSDFTGNEFAGIGSLDLVAMRTEIYQKPGSLPTVSYGSFDQDCIRRDFTINALYLRLSDFLAGNISSASIVDKTTGLEDLDKRLIRVMHDKSFIDDPTRLFRAVRYMCRIGGKLEPQTEKLFIVAVATGALDTISRQRILNELRKACQVKEWKDLLVSFAERGLLTDLVGSADISRLKKMLDSNLTDAFDLLCAALYHLNPDQDKFHAYGFGKKFFRQASEYGRHFELI